MAGWRRLLLIASLCVAGGLVAVPAASALTSSQRAQAIAAEYSSGDHKMSCRDSSPICAEVANPQDFWGYWYVGHDEPSVLFYSSHPGSGNNATYQVTLPRDPAGPYSNRKSYNFELSPAFWFGMVMCDNFSSPQTNPNCPPDTDANAVNVRTNSRHPGNAYMELQFYPPGWVPEFAGISCDPKKWCAALTIDSLSENPVAGKDLNQTCQNDILGGIEYINFAYLTHNGEPQGPPNPLEFDPEASGIPGPHVLYMSPGDRLTVSMHDTPDGLVTRVVDHTTGQSGFMTASAQNGFGHIRPAPTGSSCNVQYYDFHPMYSTSQPKTIPTWTASTYNVAFDAETGHFDFCTHIDANTGNCNGLEGIPGDREPADGDDQACFGSEESLLYPVTGCANTNDPGFDGVPYHRLWPNGSSTHPTSFLFSSPTTTGGVHYSQVGFNADLPRIEAADLGGVCDRVTGQGCTNPPKSDDGNPVPFYPYYSTVAGPDGCDWGVGGHLPNTLNNFGGSSKAEYGPLVPNYRYVFNGGGATMRQYNVYQRVIANPC